jgi:predicted transcriptional regulator
MKDTWPQFQPADDSVLISVRPQYVEQIVSGEKNVEFRRVWPLRSIGTLVVYSTSPSQCLAAVVEVTETVRASKATLWRVATEEGGGITKRALMDYFTGKDLGIALRLGRRTSFSAGLTAKSAFGPSFRAPQSFRYLNDREKAVVRKLLNQIK